MGRTKVGRTRRLAVNRDCGRLTAGRLGLCVVGTVLALPGMASAATVKADFNGDGRSDLAVGVAHEDVDGVSDAGAVNVIYGSASGVTSAGDQVFTQDTSGIEDSAEEAERFGWALAAGDFNGDDRADLAVGVLGEDIGGTISAGAVNVIYGSASGLTSAGDQFFHQDTSGIGDLAESGDSFGNALTAGDFNGDGRADLAAGVYFEDIRGISNTGAVNVIYGSASGLTSAGDQVFSQDTSGIEDEAEELDRFGFALAAGDFNGDGRGDLAVGVPREGIADVGALAGTVSVIYGFERGLTVAGDQVFSQDTVGIDDTAEELDRFGFALAADDFNGDGRSDLAVGVPVESIFSISAAGAVNVIYGSASGLTGTGDSGQFRHQNTGGIEDAAEAGENFGHAVAVGDFNGDGRADLAAGVPREDVGSVSGSVSDAGGVNVIYGSGSGLTTTGNQFFSQNTSGIEDAAERLDSFGFALAAGDFNGDNGADLAAGVYFEDIGSVSDAGGVNVIYGSGSGLTTTNDQFFSQNTSGIEDGAEPGDLFGRALESR